jgi:hypothetical protein
MAGKRSERLAFDRSLGSAVEFCSLSPSELRRVAGGESYATQNVRQYEAIVFVGGWGASMYQYDFPGDY